MGDAMWFRRLMGSALWALLLALGGFLGMDELRGPEPARWWFPVFALAPGAIILGTWLTWSVPRSDGLQQGVAGPD